MTKEDQILTAIEKMDERQTRLEGAIENLSEAVEKLTENQNRMEGAIEKLTENQNRMEDAIAKLTENQLIFAERQKQTVAAIGELRDRMDHFEHRMDGMEARIDRLEDRMGRFEDALNRMDNRFLLQQKSIDRINGSLVDLYERFDHLDKRTAENTQYISALMDGQLRMQITMEKNHQELCQRLDSLEHNVIQWKEITEQHSSEIMHLKKAQ